MARLTTPTSTSLLNASEGSTLMIDTSHTATSKRLHRTSTKLFGAAFGLSAASLLWAVGAGWLVLTIAVIALIAGVALDFTASGYDQGIRDLEAEQRHQEHLKEIEAIKARTAAAQAEHEAWLADTQARIAAIRGEA